MREYWRHNRSESAASRECIQFWNSVAAFGLARPHDHARAGGHGVPSFFRINDIDGLAGFLVADNQIAGAVIMMARSPSTMRLGVSVADCTCMTSCLASFSK